MDVDCTQRHDRLNVLVGERSSGNRMDVHISIILSAHEDDPCINCRLTMRCSQMLKLYLNRMKQFYNSWIWVKAFHYVWNFLCNFWDQLSNMLCCYTFLQISNKNCATHWNFIFIQWWRNIFRNKAWINILTVNTYLYTPVQIKWIYAFKFLYRMVYLAVTTHTRKISLLRYIKRMHAWIDVLGVIVYWS